MGRPGPKLGSQLAKGTATETLPRSVRGVTKPASATAAHTIGRCRKKDKENGDAGAEDEPAESADAEEVS